MPRRKKTKRGFATKFPSLLGFGKNQYSLAHGWNKPDGAEALGKWDRFRAEQLS